MNFLTVNHSKCKYMVVSRKGLPTLLLASLKIIKDFLLEKVDTFRYLGVYLTNNLSWSAHALCIKDWDCSHDRKFYNNCTSESMMQLY